VVIIVLFAAVGVAVHEVSYALDYVCISTAVLTALGITAQAPAEDRYLMRRLELLGCLAGLMGGRAAAEIMCSANTTGAAQDIKQATISHARWSARSASAHWAMS
jgi:ATP-dependent Zn protease